MKLFQCQNCQNLVYFNSSSCVSCGFRLGFIAEQTAMSAVTENGDTWTALADPARPYIFCANAADNVCNWLLSAGDDHTYCRACRHNRTIPDLAIVGNWLAWSKLEAAKRQLFYSLLRLNLSAPDQTQGAAEPLVFDFVADQIDASGNVQKKLTGHADGMVTMNLAEADDAERERRRGLMHEPYRTLLGHFRHEVGHYFWDRLVRDGGKVDAFRAVFGDESVSYEAALQRHYEQGPPTGWELSFISSYATTHPWEDFAETWAHYIHIVDALETARSFGVKIHSPAQTPPELSTDIDFDPYRAVEAIQLVHAMVGLSVAVNSVNRSMGQPDVYPFVFSSPVIEKLNFIHQLVMPFR